MQLICLKFLIFDAMVLSVLGLECLLGVCDGHWTLVIAICGFMGRRQRAERNLNMSIFLEVYVLSTNQRC